jgi:hypothetical protein
VLIAAMVHPARGMGVEICMYRRALDVQCPGCGLTRSVSCAARGMWHESVLQHPLGVLVLGLAVAMAAWPLLPRAWRAGVATWTGRRKWIGPAATLCGAWSLAAVALWRLLG